ncbi:hypothetical protein [Geodermatophilus sp. SYSU D00684]
MSDRIAELMRARAIEDAALLSSLSRQPQFETVLAEIDSAPSSERINRAFELLNVHTLRERGIQLPEGTKSSLNVQPSALDPNDIAAEVPVVLEFCLESPWPGLKWEECFELVIDNVDLEWW